MTRMRATSPVATLCLAAIVTTSAVDYAGGQLERIPDKLVILTFDDSKASHYTSVRPLLKKYEIGRASCRERV